MRLTSKFTARARESRAGARGRGGQGSAVAQDRDDLPERAEFTVVFESTEHGSRIHVTRTGFGEGDDADIFNESNTLDGCTESWT